jgi:hypothetical protein
MKRACILFALVTLAATGVLAQGTEKKAETTKPVTALAWLVGGVWTADASKLGGGMQRIETRYQWSDNDAYIRFNTHFVTEKQTLRNYDGSFFWDPERSTLAMWYMDARNEITQGPVKLEGDNLSMEFRATDFEGKPADFRVQVMRKTNDDYGWLLEKKQAKGWKQVLALEYLRTAGS